MQEQGLRPGRAAFDPVIRAWTSGGPSGAQPSRALAWVWKALEAGVELLRLFIS